MSAGGTRLTTQPTGGGDKKAGSVPRATGFMLNSGIRHAALGRNGRGEGRAGSGFISQTNQLAGIGSKRSMTIGTADGINKSLIKKTTKIVLVSVMRAQVMTSYVLIILFRA